MSYPRRFSACLDWRTLMLVSSSRPASVALPRTDLAGLFYRRPSNIGPHQPASQNPFLSFVAQLLFLCFPTKVHPGTSRPSLGSRRRLSLVVSPFYALQNKFMLQCTIYVDNSF